MIGICTKKHTTKGQQDSWASLPQSIYLAIPELDPVLQEQQAVAVYDIATSLLIVRDLIAGDAFPPGSQALAWELPLESSSFLNQGS